MSSVRPPLQASRRRRVRRRSAASPPSRGASVATQPVSHTADRLDAGRAFRSQLLAEQVDVRLHRVRGERGPIRPGVVEQLVAAEDLPGPAKEALQDRVFAAAQLNLPPGDSHAAQRLVERDRPRGEPHGRARWRSPAQRAEPCEQLLVGERLHEVVIGAGVQPGHPVPHRIPRRQHQDRHRVSHPAELPRDLETGPVRQPDIEDDRLEARGGPVDLQALIGRLSGLHRVAVLRQEPPEEPDEPGVILDDQQVHEISCARQGVTMCARQGVTSVTSVAVTVRVVVPPPAAGLAPASGLAPGAPNAPAIATCTCTFFPVVTSAAIAAACAWYVVALARFTVTVLPFASLRVIVVPDIESTVPVTRTPPPKPPRPNPAAPAPPLPVPPLVNPPLPKPPGVEAAAAGAVARPTANVTPPTATRRPTARRTRNARSPFLAGAMTGGGGVDTVWASGAV